jgi:hypothetical protein
MMALGDRIGDGGNELLLSVTTLSAHPRDDCIQQRGRLGPPRDPRWCARRHEPTVGQAERVASRRPQA